MGGAILQALPRHPPPPRAPPAHHAALPPSSAQSAYEAWLDDREEASERTRALLHRTVQANYSADGGNTVWARRMADKYGVTASQVAASARGARQTAALANDDPLLGP